MTKNEILTKNPNFGRKFKFVSKIRILVIIEILVENPNICQKSKLWSKIEILVKNRNFAQKFLFSIKLEKKLTLGSPDVCFDSLDYTIDWNNGNKYGRKWQIFATFDFISSTIFYNILNFPKNYFCPTISFGH